MAAQVPATGPRLDLSDPSPKKRFHIQTASEGEATASKIELYKKTLAATKDPHDRLSYSKLLAEEKLAMTESCYQFSKDLTAKLKSELEERDLTIQQLRQQILALEQEKQNLAAAFQKEIQLRDILCSHVQNQFVSEQMVRKKDAAVYQKEREEAQRCLSRLGSEKQELSIERDKFKGMVKAERMRNRELELKLSKSETSFSMLKKDLEAVIQRNEELTQTNSEELKARNLERRRNDDLESKVSALQLRADQQKQQLDETAERATKRQRKIEEIAAQLSTL